jgi:hypothetical protein
VPCTRGTYADLRPDRADLVGFAAVGTNLLVDDHHAQLFLFHALDDLARSLCCSHRIFEQRAERFASFGDALDRFGRA